MNLQGWPMLGRARRGVARRGFTSACTATRNNFRARHALARLGGAGRGITLAATAVRQLLTP